MLPKHHYTVETERECDMEIRWYFPSFLSKVTQVAAVWNSLPDNLRDPAVDSEQFRQNTNLFAGH